MNNKYKSVLCKHFGQNGTCSYGDKCQFAHGFQELKNTNIGMGMQPNLSMSQNSNEGQKTKSIPNPSNFKIVKCKNWETTGTCKYGSVCTFAHGDNELRTKTENTQKMSENSILMDTGFAPNTMNPYLMQDPAYIYNLMMQQQMMSMQMNPEIMKQHQGYPDMMNQYGGYQGHELNLNDNNMFFQQPQEMQPQDYSGMNSNFNYTDYMNMQNMQQGNLNPNHNNMFMGGKP
jgi:hypothetical protein